MQPLIEAQIAGRDDVEFHVELDNGEAPSGTKRQRLLDRASGTYVAFVDDDDEVTPSYVRDLVERCHDVDVVTFRLDFYSEERRKESWRLGLHRDDRRRGLMAANHLCAWRADLARRVSWSPIGYADDQAWYGPLHASGLVRWEAHVPRVLYRYLFSRSTTENQRPSRIAAARSYFGDGLRCYRDFAGEIFVAAGQSSTEAFHRGRLATINPDALELFHVVKLA